MELMGPYPGRRYRMVEIVRYVVGQKPDNRRRHAVREAVRQVLRQLAETGIVQIDKADTRGSFNEYIWKVQDELGGIEQKPLVLCKEEC
jgi:lauroyl/myristoyl acyltransferase